MRYLASIQFETNDTDEIDAIYNKFKKFVKECESNFNVANSHFHEREKIRLGCMCGANFEDECSCNT